LIAVKLTPIIHAYSLYIHVLWLYFNLMTMELVKYMTSLILLMVKQPLRKLRIWRGRYMIK